MQLVPSHPLVLANAVQVRLAWDFGGIVAYNVLGGSVTGGYVNTQAVANALDTAVKGHYTSSGLKARHSTQASLQSVGIRDVRAANQVEYIGTGGPVIGTGTANALPTQLAAVITLRTALAGRSFRGRVYIGGADEDQNEATGTILAAYNAAAVAFVTNVQTDMAAQGITLAILSRPRYDPASPFGLVYAGALTPVTAIVARDQTWDIQRRRKS